MPDPYYWDDARQLSLPTPAGGVPGGGGIFGGLFGGGQQQAVPGLLNGGGVNDALINQLLQRQIEAATQPDFGAFAAALGRAAQPSLLPKSVGAALAEASGALSGNREQGLARALQSAKLLQDLQLARRKQSWIEKFLQDESSGSDPAKDILNPTGIPGIKPLASTVPPAGTPLGSGGRPIVPRVTGTDETTGDLSGSYGEPATADAAGGDADLTAGTPAPRPQAGLTGSAWELANNNFGGLRKPGVIAGPSQGGFQSFASPEQGVAAISRQLARYASGATTGTPLTTVRQIVSTWAPPNENPTEALIARASRIVGADPDAPLDVSNPQVKAKLIEAMIANEQGGRMPVARDLISRVAASNPAPTASSSVSIPPPRVDPNAWYNQPVTRSVFRDPSVDPSSVPAAERLRQSILGTLAGGSPLVNPDQSPTAAVRGGLPPQDEVVPSGRGSIPGLLRAQYTGQVNPDQSPSIQMGGQPMPPMPAIPQPQAPAGASPYGTSVPPMPSVPMPANLDPTRLQSYMLDLARKSAMAEALGLPNIYGPKLQVLMQSPQYQAMQEFAKKGVELQYAGPKAAQERAALQPYMLEQDAYKAHLDATNKQIEQLGAAALDPTTITVADGNGKQVDIGATRAQAARAYAGLGVPELGIPARVAPRAGDTGPPAAGTPVGKPTGTAADINKARIELDSGAAKSLQEQAITNRQFMPVMDEIIRLADKTPGGWAGPVSAALAKTLSGLGYHVPEGMSNAELMAALGQRLIPTVRQPGAQSNMEMQAYLAAVPGLLQSKEGRIKLAEMNKALMARTNELAGIYRTHLGQSTLDEKLAEFDNKPLWNEEQRAVIGFGKPTGSASSGGPTISSPGKPRLKLSPDGQSWVPE